MADATKYLEYDRDSSYPVHHHRNPPFKTRAATISDAIQI
jgi:hypothetical protein